MKRTAIFFVLGFGLVCQILQQADVFAKPSPQVDQEQIKKLVRQLGDDDFKKREEASKKLVEIGARAVGELEIAVKSGEAEIATRAKTCLQRITDREAISGLIANFENANPAIRVRATQELLRIGDDAVPALRKAMKHKNKEVRREAINVLANLHSKAGPAAKDLIEALDDEDLEIAVSAAVGLGNIGEQAKSGIPKLLRIYKDDKKPDQLRACAGNSLGYLKAEEAAPVFFEYLKDKKKSRFLRVTAAGGLAQIGYKPDEVVPVLRKILADKTDEIRGKAIGALSRLGPKAKIAVPDLIKVLKDDKEPLPLRERVVSDLGGFGADAKDAVPDLIAVLKGKRAGMTGLFTLMAAIRSLGQIGPAAHEAISVLEEFAAPGHPLKEEATRALARIEGKK